MVEALANNALLYSMRLRYVSHYYNNSDACSQRPKASSWLSYRDGFEKLKIKLNSICQS